MAANTTNNANKASVFRFAAFFPNFVVGPDESGFAQSLGPLAGFAAIDFFNTPTDTSSIGS